MDHVIRIFPEDVSKKFRSMDVDVQATAVAPGADARTRFRSMQ